MGMVLAALACLFVAWNRAKHSSCAVESTSVRNDLPAVENSEGHQSVHLSYLLTLRIRKDLATKTRSFRGLFTQRERRYEL